MAEILTESFCERCGTRYTFEAAIPKKRRIGKLKVLSKGLKNYVLSDDASLDEALAEARSEEQREVSGGQLDAFHQTFQFCMSCRQYTCANCWNDTEGRCLSCAPLSVGGGQLRSPLDDLLAGGGGAPFASPSPLDEALGAAAARNGHGPLEEPSAGFPAPAAPVAEPAAAGDEPARIVGSAWPTIDLFRDPEAAIPMGPPAESLNGAGAPSAPAESPTDEAELTQAATHAEAVEPAEALQSEPGAKDFWARPFTGYAPVPEPTNGHEPAAAGIVTPPDEPSPAPVAELAAEEPEPATAVGAPASAPEADARAVELAERTTRLLGRFRVQPRSAGSVPAVSPVDGSPAPTQSQPAEQAQPATESQPEPIAQPVWKFVPSPAPEPEPILAAEPEPEPVVAAEPEPEPVVAAEPEPEPVVPVATAPEPEPVVPVAEPEPEPILAAEPEPEPVLAAEPEPEPEPVVAAEPEPEPIVPVATAPDEPRPQIMEARPQLRPAAIDRIEMPAWPTPVRPPLSDSAAIAPAIPAFPPASMPSPPASPVAPQWPAPLRPDLDASSTPFWASGGSGIDPGADFWNASAREVAGVPGQAVSAVGVQSCVSCGLSLSATARFCRRCGSRQG